MMTARIERERPNFEQGGARSKRRVSADDRQRTVPGYELPQVTSIAANKSNKICAAPSACPFVAFARAAFHVSVALTSFQFLTAKSKTTLRNLS